MAKAQFRHEAFKNGYRLGLDLGSTSVGWAVIPANDEDISEETLILGSHIFDAGVDPKEKKSRNLERRAARQRRRMAWRRSRRKLNLYRALVEGGFFPQEEGATVEERRASRHNYLMALDAGLIRKFGGGRDRIAAQTYLYRLRRAALDEELTLEEVGRVLFSLGQRRGFLSNRKTAASEEGDDKDEGKVKGDISQLGQAMAESGARTLGEFFAGLDPEELGSRIRKRYTGRAMYLSEFEQVWAAQAAFHPEVMSGEAGERLKKRIYREIFHQRPLKSQRGRVALCSLETHYVGGKARGPRVASKADPLFQEYRYWQKIIDMAVYDPRQDEYGEGKIGWRSLTREEQDVVAELCANQEKASFTAIRKALETAFPDVWKYKPKTSKDADPSEKADKKLYWKFNLEFDGGDKGLHGAVTRAKVRKALGEFSAETSTETVDEIAAAIRFFEKDEPLKKKLRALKPNLTDEVVKALVAVTLPSDYASLSHKAAGRLLEYMKSERVPVMTARKMIYSLTIQETAQSRRAEYLEPVEKALGDVRNPTVTRALTETRKVVNAILRAFGGRKPEYVRVELARDLKLSQKKLDELKKRNEERKKIREKSREDLREIFRNLNITSEPTNRDILKYELWEECGHICPYTFKKISERALFGDQPEFDIEHIIPFSRSLDDSFANKTLCEASENRDVKKNQTPYEAYGQDPEKWEAMKRHARQYFVRNGKTTRKYELFTCEDAKEIEGMPQSLLNDTRYISRLATEYLATLYGADATGVEANPDGEKGNKRVRASNGSVTAWMRREWDLNIVLARLAENLGVFTSRDDSAEARETKSRVDHRHHALDALMVALTNDGLISQLSRSAAEQDAFVAPGGRDKSSRLFARNFPEPVPDFGGYDGIVYRVLSKVIVSNRVDRKVSGSLHDESIYSPKTAAGDNGKRAFRKPVASMSEGEVQAIIDPVVREAVLQKIEDVGGIKKIALLADNPPRLPGKNGAPGPAIKKARFWKSVKTIRIGGNSRREVSTERFVAPGSNHHIEVYAVLDPVSGEEIKWNGELVTLIEAYRRVRDNEPVVRHDFGPNTRFKFSLSKGEAFKINGSNDIYIVRSISQEKTGAPRLDSTKNTDTRSPGEVKNTENNQLRLRPFTTGLLKMGFVKIRIDVLGEVSPAND